jgi:hypothetical protein
MPWYKSGTVSVTQNSNAVIGTSTAFLSNGRVGDAFRGPDGGWYEVTNIASDTAMTIAPVYQGVTAAGGLYALAPMQGYVKESADALRALVNQFGGVLAVLGNTPTTDGVRAALNLTNADGLPEGATNKYMTALGVRSTVLTGLVITDATPVVGTDAILAAFGKLQAQATAKAAKGANSDITSLSGLTTALSLGQGGTGVTSMPLLIAALQAAGAYGKTNVLGTVSQASGVPTGAVIERGSNSNGEYVKFADGTMICTFRADGAPQAVISSTGSMFQAGSEITWNFPSTFIAVPMISSAVARNDAAPVMGCYHRTVTTTATTWRIWSSISMAAGNVKDVYLTAIGRWF